MNKFLLNSTLFLIAFIALNTFVYFLSQKVYRPDYTVIPNKSFRSFVFADSHGKAMDTNPEEYNIYNFSYGGDSYFDMKRKINYLIDNDYQIDTVYITVDDHTLSPYRERSNNRHISSFFLTNSSNNDNYDYIKNKYIRYYGTMFQPRPLSFSRVYLYRKLLSIISSDESSKSDDKEWISLTKSEKRETSESRKEAQFPSEFKGQLLENTLIDIISLSKKHKFKLIGVKFPLPKIHIETLGDSNYGSDEVFQTYNVAVLDYRNIYINNDEYFLDADHLNDLGGKVFTKMLFDK